MPFPQDRYSRAGASPAQLAELEAAYDELDAEAQASYDARLAPLSDYEISEQLADVSEPVADVEDAPAEAAAPASTTLGASTSWTDPLDDASK